MNFGQFSSSFAPKNGPLVQFIVQFITIKIQEKEELSSVQVPKNQVNLTNLVLWTKFLYSPDKTYVHQMTEANLSLELSQYPV